MFILQDLYLHALQFLSRVAASDIYIKVYIGIRKVALCPKAPFCFSSVFGANSSYYFADEMTVCLNGRDIQ